MKEQHIIKVHPMEGMKPPKLSQEIIQPYTKEQLSRMLAACDDTTFLGARNKALILLFLSTGLRKKEMSEVQLKDVNFTQRIIKVMGKGAKGRIVGFGTQASRALMVYFIQRKSRVKPGNEDWLWLSEEGFRLQYSGLGTAINDLVVFIGLKDIHSRVHALRHSFATESLRNGAGLKDVQSLMGHSTPTMTLKYAKTVNSEDAVRNHPKFDPADHWF
jgi:site-specific recombinase XerD